MSVACTAVTILAWTLTGRGCTTGVAAKPQAPAAASERAVAPPSTAGEVEAVPSTDPVSGDIVSVDDLLSRLEHADRDIRDYHANLVYEKFDALVESSERRFGRLVFEVDPNAGRRLAFVFDQYVDGAGRTERIDQRYVFAGSWLCDVDAQRKQFIKRQVVPPDQRFDPLKVGEGPFPLPIGQAASEVRSRFDVALAPPPTAKLLAALDAGTLHCLRLVPKAGTEAARDFAQIDLYYDRETLMPVAVDAEGLEGDRKIVRLSKAAVNAGLSAADTALLSIEPPDPGQWTIDIRAWRTDEPAP